jgi:hypothetical protein
LYRAARHAATADYRLPVEAVREALAYVEQNRELLETEAEIECLMLQRGENARSSQIVRVEWRRRWLQTALFFRIRNGV